MTGVFDASVFSVEVLVLSEFKIYPLIRDLIELAEFHILYNPVKYIYLTASFSVKDLLLKKATK